MIHRISCNTNSRMQGLMAALLRRAPAAGPCGGLLRGSAALWLPEGTVRQVLHRGMSSVAAPSDPKLIRNFAIIGAASCAAQLHL